MSVEGAHAIVVGTHKQLRSVHLARGQVDFGSVQFGDVAVKGGTDLRSSNGAQIHAVLDLPLGRHKTVLPLANLRSRGSWDYS